MLIFIFCFTLVFAKQNPLVLQYTGVQVQHKHSEHDVEKFHIQRIQAAECLDIEISPETLYDKELISVDIKCKRTLATTVGKVQPMKIANGVQTVGEIEVLDFIKNKSSKNPQKYLLVDSRKLNWYEHSTIPGAVNIPYTYMEYDKDFEVEYNSMLSSLSIKKVGDKYDFSKAKTVLMFCNGNWCDQSPSAIKILLKMGYPAKKILWYRGGLQSWIMLGFNTIKPK
jgi:rhodanese-related sulfurtransferase